MSDHVLAAGILALLMGIVFATLNVPLPLACVAAVALALIVFHALEL